MFFLASHCVQWDMFFAAGLSFQHGLLLLFYCLFLSLSICVLCRSSCLGFPRQEGPVTRLSLNRSLNEIGLERKGNNGDDNIGDASICLLCS